MPKIYPQIPPTSHKFDLYGSAMGYGTLADPYMSVRDSSGGRLKESNDGGTGTDSNFTYTATTTGTHFLAAGSNNSGTGTYWTQLTDVTPVVVATPTDDYLASTGTIGVISVGGMAPGTIETTLDTDWFKTTLTAGRTYKFDLYGSAMGYGTLADPYMSVRDSSGGRLKESNDGGTGTDSSFTYTATTTGTHFLAAGSNNSGTGTYWTQLTDVTLVAGSALSIAALSANNPEGNSGSTPFTFTVARTGSTTAASSVSYSVSGGTATASDFTGGILPSGTINFAAGDKTPKTITINVAGDTRPEPTETFNVVLSNASGATLGTPTATGTIRDDDATLLTAKYIFISQGDGVESAGMIRVMADFSKAAYYLQSWEKNTPGGLLINDVSAYADTAYGELMHQWAPLDLTLTGLPDRSTLTLATTPSADNMTVNNAMSGGYYTQANAAAFVARSGDSVVISFRGTNDNGGGDSDIVHPDKDQWGAPNDGSLGKMSDHYALFTPLLDALGTYISTHGVAHVYVTGHSLGGAMALKYMSTHWGDSKYEAVTFAAPSFTWNSVGESLQFLNDNRVRQIEIAQDPVPMSWEAGRDTHRSGDRVLFVGNNTMGATEGYTAISGLVGFYGNSEYHSMDYYRQITRSVDPASWQTILQQPMNQDVLIGARQLRGDFIVDGQNINHAPSIGYDDVIASGYNDILSYSSNSKSVIYYGGLGNDTLTGGTANELLIGGAGNDTINGGSGTDTAVYAGNQSFYTITHNSNGPSTVKDNTGAEGTDTLTNIERLKFADKKLALDMDGSAGITAKLIAAAFGLGNLTPALVGEGIGIFDQGYTLKQIAQPVINTSLFQSLADSSSNTDFVKLVYKNVVGVLPSAAELNYYAGILNNGMSQADLLVRAVNSDANIQYVNLVGLASTGLEYL